MDPKRVKIFYLLKHIQEKIKALKGSDIKQWTIKQNIESTKEGFLN